MTVDQRGFHQAMAQYAALKNKSDADVVNKAMRYVLPAAARRVKDKTPGGSKIRRELIGRAKKPSRGRNKMQEQLANTVAAAIVAGRMRKRGPVVLPRRKDADAIDNQRISDFYQKVRDLVNAKVRSANFLRAGFIPAFRRFDVPNRSVAGQQHFKGRSKGIKAKPSLTGVVEAFATNQREGAYKIAPNAFTEAIRDIRGLFMKWITEEINKNAKKSGF